MIDFRKSRILDPAWWRYLRVTLSALERKGRGKALQASFDYHLALVANGSLTEKSFESAQSVSKERYFDLLGNWRPWEGRDYAERKGKEFKDGRQAYIDAFGVDPLDPKFKEWEAAKIAEMEKANSVSSVDDETRVSRKILAQRLAKVKKRGTRA